MPNIKSAKKRVIVNQKKTEQNKNIRSAVKTEIKKVEALVKENKIEEAKALLPNAFALIDSAASKNIIHANNAANKKAKLAKKVDSAAVPVKTEAKPAKVKETPVKEVKAEPVVEEVKEAAPIAEEKPAPKAKKPAAKKPATKDDAEQPVKKVSKPRAKKAEEPKAE